MLLAADVNRAVALVAVGVYGFSFLQNYVTETHNYGIVFVSLSVMPSVK